MAEKTCAQCRYYVPDFGDIGDMGNCHANPPTIIQPLVMHVWKSKDARPNLDDIIAIASVFPKTVNKFPACHFFAMKEADHG